MLNSERDRTFNGGLAGHTGILFKVVHAYAFEHADRQDLFQEIVIQIWRSVDAFRGESSVPVDVPRRAEHGNRVDAQGGRRQAAARGCGRPVDKVSGWDYAVAVAGLAATLALWRTIYVGYREQARREQAFGDSLRDQVNRQIAMIDPFMINPWATRASRKKVAP